MNTKLRLNFINTYKDKRNDEISVSALELDDCFENTFLESGCCSFFIYCPNNQGIEWASKNFKVDKSEIEIRIN